MTNPFCVPFQCPPHLAALLIDKAEARHLQQAEREAAAFLEAAADPARRRRQVQSPYIDVFRDGPFYGAPVLAAVPNRKRAMEAARDGAAQMIRLLEDRVTQHLAQGDRVIRHDLQIVGDRIEGHVYGEAPDGAFRVFVRMIWNYRYGENSANGQLTVYPQFRSERHGARQAGKPIVTQAQAEKEARAAERAAKRAEKEAADRERFIKGIAREAKRARKEAAECQKEADLQGAGHHAEWLQGQAEKLRALADALDLMGPDVPLLNSKGEPVPALVRFGTASALRDFLARQQREVAHA